jgi:hypothetical protein
MKRLTIHYNHKSKLYIMELENDEVKSLVPAPRWVKDKATLLTWLDDRIKDKTFPPDAVITFE